MTVSEFFARCSDAKFIASGFGASVYRVTAPGGATMAVKVAHRPVQSGRDIEVSALTLLANCDTVPEYYQNLAPCAKYPFGGFVLEWVEGAPMTREFDLATLGRAIGLVHATTETLPDLQSATIEQMSPADALTQECFEYLDILKLAPDLATRVTQELDRRALDYVRAIPAHTKSCLVHTDLISENILVSETNVTLIDWEYARWSHPFWDLAHFIAPTATLWDNPPATPYDLSDLEALATGYVSTFGRYSVAETTRAVSALVPLSAMQSTLWAKVQLAEAESADIPDYDRLLRYDIEDLFKPNAIELAQADPL